METFYETFDGVKVGPTRIQLDFQGVNPTVVCRGNSMLVAIYHRHPPVITVGPTNQGPSRNEVGFGLKLGPW